MLLIHVHDLMGLVLTGKACDYKACDYKACVYKACDYLNFPNIHILLQLALTLPITSCESERSFSQLKLIKTSRRSTMIADRLSGLAIMKVNRNYCDKLCMAELVKSFMERHPRRIKLPFILSD